MTREDLQGWLDTYVLLWRTPGTDRLGEIFTEDASYSTGPFEEPFVGLDAIREMWDKERLTPGEEFELDSEIVAVDGDAGVIRLEVRYSSPRDQLYKDVWIVVLDNAGRCRRFEEWPFWPPGTDGGVGGWATRNA